MSPNWKAAFFFFFLFLCSNTHAQPIPTLPKIEAVTKDGINLLKWINPYTSGITSVSIQRSADSTFNFETIGLIKDIGNAEQAFVDSRPLLGKNWYRIVILFTSGTSWTSNETELTLDSSQIAARKPLPANDSVQKLVGNMNSSSPDQIITTINQKAAYPKSQYVYTDPFTGNIDINISDALVNDYALHFYDQKGDNVLTIPRINDTAIILDKRNFQTTGMFKFKLLKENKEFAEGYVAIY